MSSVRRLVGGNRYLVAFPTSRPSGYPSNDTVWADYFRPEGPGPFPAVIVLHSWGSRSADTEYLFCRVLMQHRIASLMVHLPFHLRRKLPHRRSGEGFIVTDPKITARRFQQAFADVQSATQWLKTRTEVDPQRVGIAGISLGAIIAAACLGREKELQCGALILGGADLTTIANESPFFRFVRHHLRKSGITDDQLRTIWRDVEPLTYVSAARDKPVLLINALHDWVMPRKSSRKLEHAFSHPHVVEINTGHLGGDIVKHQAIELVSLFLRNTLTGESHPTRQLITELNHSPGPKISLVSCKPARLQLAVFVELLSFPRSGLLSIDVGITHNAFLAGVACDVAKVAGNFAFDIGAGYSYQPGHEPRNYLALSLHF